jgi:coxsackievirus/adenovirus receptor
LKFKIFLKILNFFYRADAQKEDAINKLNNIIDSKEIAEKAVKDGDNTLKKANDTYHLLQSFQSQVQESSEAAQIALQQVPEIVAQMDDIDKLVADTENVRNLILIFECN